MTKKQKKKLISLLIALVISGLSLVINKQQPTEVLGSVAPGYYRVIRFDDGDTITIDMNGKSEKIRFVGVDTPETQDPRKPVQCFGHAASEFTKNLVGNNPVRLESDELSSNRDRYNRLLRYVYLPDGQLVQAEIIREGYGFAYLSFPFTKSEEFRALATQARIENKGLWNSCTPATNEYGGFTSNPE